MPQERRIRALVGAAILNFVGVISIAGGALALRFGESLAPIGFGLGCVEFIIAMTTVAVVLQVGNPGLRTQGKLFVGCSIMGACILIVCYIGLFSNRSVAFVYSGFIFLTSVVFGLILARLMRVGMDNLRDTKNELSSSATSRV